MLEDLFSVGFDDVQIYFSHHHSVPKFNYSKITKKSRITKFGLFKTSPILPPYYLLKKSYFGCEGYGLI